MTSRYGLEIRAPATADLAGLAELMSTAGPVVGTAALADRLAAVRANGAVLIAAEWGPPSGVIVLHWMQTLGTARPGAVVSTLLVRPEDRRRGIGRLLVKAAAQVARQAGCEELAVTGSGEVRAFCLATGFFAAGTEFRRGLRRQG